MFQRTCVARIIVGSGRPHGQRGRYMGFDTGIEADAFRDAVEKIVRAAFPKGSTEFHARGTWRDGDSNLVVSESGIVAEVWLPEDPSPEACRKHLAKAWFVARALARKFGQDAVSVIGDDGTGQTVSDFVKQDSEDAPWDAPRRPKKAGRYVKQS